MKCEWVQEKEKLTKKRPVRERKKCSRKTKYIYRLSNFWTDCYTILISGWFWFKKYIRYAWCIVGLIYSVHIGARCLWHNMQTVHIRRNGNEPFEPIKIFGFRIALIFCPVFRCSLCSIFFWEKRKLIWKKRFSLRHYYDMRRILHESMPDAIQLQKCTIFFVFRFRVFGAKI